VLAYAVGSNGFGEWLKSQKMVLKRFQKISFNYNNSVRRRAEVATCRGNIGGLGELNKKTGASGGSACF